MINIHRPTRALLTIVLSLPCWTAQAQEPAPKSIIALVGDTDKFNIGQTDFCGDRSDVASPSGKQFRIPSNKRSFFYIRSKFYAQAVTYTCEGDYSFKPSPGQLYVIRYTMTDRCVLEMFVSEPGGSPQPMEFQREQSRSCLFK
jgi:hypothetical protein